MEHLQQQIDDLNARLDALSEQLDFRLVRYATELHTAEANWDRRFKSLQEQIWSLERRL